MSEEEKYEEFRKHYANFEEREQKYIVQIQRLLIKLSENKK